MKEQEILSTEKKHVKQLTIDFNHELVGYLNDNQYVVVIGRYYEADMTIPYYNEQKTHMGFDNDENIIEIDRIYIAIPTEEYEANVKEYWKQKKRYSKSFGDFSGVGYYGFGDMKRNWGIANMFDYEDDEDNAIYKDHEIVLGKKMFVEIEHG